MKRILAFGLAVVLTISLLTGCVLNSSDDSTNSNASTAITLPSNVEKVDKKLVDANTQFAFDIFKELGKEDPNGNVFISPLSISTALSMTYQGAKGKTQQDMSKALHYEGISLSALNQSYANLLGHLNKIDDKVELNINNSIWIREGKQIQPSFLSVNKEFFGSKIESLDFSKIDAADKINKWIEDATKGKIEKMIEPPISADVLMYLINAIYFKGQWTEQFDAKFTKDAPFQSINKKNTTVKMMSRKGTVEYGKGDGYKAVRLPYGNGKTSMYCILPDEGINLNSMIETLDSKKWDTIKSKISKTDDVLLKLPRFKMEYGIKELNNSLIALGMGDAFSKKADFSGISDNVCINRVLHKAVIDVNEEGSEAAAVTVVEMKATGMAEPITFTADRPFLFVIADDTTDTVLFIGKVMSL